MRMPGRRKELKPFTVDIDYRVVVHKREYELTEGTFKDVFMTKSFSTEAYMQEYIETLNKNAVDYEVYALKKEAFLIKKEGYREEDDQYSLNFRTADVIFIYGWSAYNQCEYSHEAKIHYNFFDEIEVA